MATKVYTAEELELQDGSKVTIKPLTIKRLRKFMKVVNELNKVEAGEDGELDEEEQEDRAMELMVDACAIAIAPSNPDLAENRERLEDALDIPTMWRILEVAGGIQMGNPTPMAGLAGTS